MAAPPVTISPRLLLLVACDSVDGFPAPPVDVQMPSHVGRERPNVLAHILRVTARQTRAPAKLFAALVGAVLALAVHSMSIASDAIDSQQIA